MAMKHKQSRLDDFLPKDEAYFLSRVIKRTNFSYPPHSHNYAEMFLIEEGELFHVVNGKKSTLTAGMLVFIRPTDQHRFESSINCSFTNVIVSKQTLDYLRKRYFSEQDICFWSTLKQPAQIQLEGKALIRILTWLREIYLAPRSRFEIERFLLGVFGELARRVEHPDRPNVPDWLRIALEKLRDPERAALGIPEFYRLAGRSPEHVSRTLKKQLGITPSEAVNRIRLGNAAGLLEMSDQSISDIALDCGFKSLGYFYSMFRLQFDITPRHYRLQKQFFS